MKQTIHAATRAPTRAEGTLRLSTIALAIGTALASPMPAFADPNDADHPTRGREIVVTATRRAETVDDTLATVTVITREDIERLQAPDLLDILRLQAGVDLARTGGSGSSTTLFVRGTNSNQTLILIDGIRVSSAPQGVYDLAHLPPEQIERIEIVRGPRASYWGSEAIGGVIQVFTRKPDGAYASVRGGSFGRLGGTAAYGWRGGNGGLSATIGGEKLDGFSATNDKAFGHDPDDDGYHNRNASFRGDAMLGSQQVSFSALSTNADVEFDQGITESEERSGGATIEGPINERWNHRATLGIARGELSTPAFGSEFQSRRSTFDWLHDFALSDANLIVAGLNAAHEEGRSSAPYDKRRDNIALHASWRHTDGGFDSELAGRYDDNSQYGGEATWQAAAGYRFGDAWRVFGSAGKGFRAPTINELYFQGFGGLFAGNPDLDPERSRSYEAGVDFAPGDAHRFGARAFHTRIEDLVAFQGENFQAINILEARIRGVELSYGWQGETTRFDANYTWQDPEGANGADLLRRARQKANALLTFVPGGAFEWGVEGVYAGTRQDFDGELPSYLVANVRGAWRFADAWRLDARVDNLFDREYELVSGYNTPDRSFRLALVYGGN